MIHIAAASYAPEWHSNWAALTEKLDRWCAKAAAKGAQLAVFPEYAGIEAALIGVPVDGTTAAVWSQKMAARANDWASLHATLAQKHDLHVLAGSICASTDDGIVNRATLCAPSGQIGHQHKLILTPYERDHMAMVGGRDLTLFETPLGKIGVLICYDSEFPLLARQLVLAGADIILVPSCTDVSAGQTRVRQSARARAIEGQCLIVQSPLIGTVKNCDVVDQQTGRSGFFCPPDYGLPSDGIIAQGETDEPGWVTAAVDPTAITAARVQGQVGNFAHWPDQDRHVKPITTCHLT